MEKEHLKYNKLAILAFMITFFIQIFLNRFVVIFRSLPDEMGAIYLASALSGNDWSYVMTHPAYYYGSLTFPLLYPFFLLVKDPLILYQCLLGVGALLRSIPVFLCFYIMIKYYKCKNYKLIFLISIASSFLTPTRATNIDNEPILLLCCWLIILMIISLQFHEGSKKQIVKSILLSLLLCVSLLAHTRAILYSIAAFITIILYHILSGKRLVHYKSFFISFLIFYKFNTFLVSKLTEFLYPIDGREATIANTAESLGGQLGGGIKQVFGPYGIQSFFDLLTSNLTVIFVFSGGIVIFCYWLYFMEMLPSLKRRIIDKNLIYDKNIIVPLSFCMIGGGGAILGLCITRLGGAVEQQMGSYSLTRGYYYLRYYANFFGPAIMLLSIRIFNIDNEAVSRKKQKIAILLSIATLFLCGSSNWLSFLSRVTYNGENKLSDWFYYFAPLSISFKSWPEASQSLLYFFSAMLIALLIFLVISLFVSRKKYVIGSLIFIILLVYQYAYLVVFWDKPYSNSENYFETVNSLYNLKKEHSELFENIDKLYYHNPVYGPQYIVQFIMADTPVFLGYPEEEDEVVCLTSYILNIDEDEEGLVHYIPLDDNEFLYIKGEKYKEYFEDEGIKLLSLETEPVSLEIGDLIWLSYEKVFFGTEVKTLKRGTYDLAVQFNAEEPAQSGKYEVVNQKNESILSEGSYNVSETSIHFSITNNDTPIQIRFYPNNKNTCNIMSIDGWKHGVYEIGSDDVLSLEKLIEMFEDEGGDINISCLVDWEDDISLKKLKEVVPGYKVNIKTLPEIKKQMNIDYILAPNSNNDWIELLENYILLENFENYKLLASLDSNLVKQTPLDKRLSHGHAISLSVWNAKWKDGFLGNHYNNIPAGQYKVTLEIDGYTQGESVVVEVWDDRSFIASIDLEASAILTVPFESYDEVNGLYFHVYNERRQLLTYTPKDITFLRNLVLFAYDLCWDELLLSKESLLGTAVFLDDANKFERKEVEKYFRMKGHDDIKVQRSVFDEDFRWEEKLYGVNSLFLPNNLELLYKALEQGFIIAAKSEKYVLLYSGDSLVEDPLSDGLTIDAKFFDYIIVDGVKQEKISLPKGIFEVGITLEGARGISTASTGIVKILDGSKVLKEIEITPADTKVLCANVSGEAGLSDLRLEIYSKEPNGLNGRLNYIRKVSDGMLVDMSEMNTTSENSLYYHGELFVLDSSESTVFGPYIELEAGEYSVSINYEALENSYIKFDISIDAGEVILAETTSDFAKRNADGLWEVFMQFGSDVDISELEIRSYILPDEEFYLKEIRLEPIK